MPVRRAPLLIALLSSALLAVSCGAPSEAPRAAVPESLPTSVPAAPTTPAASAPAGPTVAAPATATIQYKGLTASRTTDGFFTLGAADAPVTLTDYSDFL